MKKNKTLRYAVYVLIFAATLILDQVSKILTDHGGNEGSYEVIPGIINFMSVYNEGASFSLFADKPWAQDFFLVLTAIVLIAGAVYLVFTKKQSKWLGVSVALLFSGTIGNFIDRLAFKYVRDFISFAFFQFPTFNVADCCLCIGVAMLVIYLLFIDDEAIFSGENESPVADAKKSDSAAAVLNDAEPENDLKLKAKNILPANGAASVSVSESDRSNNDDVSGENGANADNAGNKTENEKR